MFGVIYDLVKMDGKSILVCYGIVINVEMTMLRIWIKAKEKYIDLIFHLFNKNINFKDQSIKQ